MTGDDGTARTPLRGSEELLWRSLMRLTITVPRFLGDQLEKSCSLSGSEYAVLVHLSEAPGRRLRMTDLAERTALSRARITRIVDALIEDDRARRVPSVHDGRSALAELTNSGLALLEQAYPVVLENVRSSVFDRVSSSEVEIVGQVLDRLVGSVESHAAADQSTRNSRRG